MRTLYGLILVLILGCGTALSQIGVNTDGSRPDSSAMLDVKSTSKGFLLPRMTYEARNSIINPAEGLIVFCTNCGLNNTGTLCVYTDANWYTFTLCKTSQPTASVNTVTSSEIVWKWHAVSDATGYKWSTSNDFNSALEIGIDTLKAETGISCDTTYTRYVWAYNDCGRSTPLTLTQSTLICFNCGDFLIIDHVAGAVAPVNKSVTYGTVTNIPGETNHCWITSNLGADHQATAKNDATEASAGWYWQFNRMQGYKHDGTNRTPNTTWISSIDEYSNWTTGNDPCFLELGLGWRIPTSTEWENVDIAGSWSTWTGPWSSALKMHASGRLSNTTGILAVRGSDGGYWGSAQAFNNTGWRLYFMSSICEVATGNKSWGYTVRCIRD